MADIYQILTAAFFSGFLYFIIWLAFRIHRHRKFKRIRKAHAEERLVRAEYRAKFSLRQEGAKTSRQAEIIRVSEWEARNGLLSDDLALTQREESYWTTGSAIQGASAVGTAVLVAFLVWGSGRYSHPSPPESSESPLSGLKHLSSSPEQDLYRIALPFFVVASVIGGILIASSKRAAGKLAGALLLVGGATAAGKVTLHVHELSAIKIDKPSLNVEINPRFDRNRGEGETSEPKSQEFAVWRPIELQLPPFSDASHELTVQQLCLLRVASPILSEKSSMLHSLQIVSSSDRRELLPEPRRIYSNNWGLARRRAGSVRDLFIASGVPSELVEIQSIGPSETEFRSSLSALARDRKVGLRILVSDASVKSQILSVFEAARRKCAF